MILSLLPFVILLVLFWKNAAWVVPKPHHLFPTKRRLFLSSSFLELEPKIEYEELYKFLKAKKAVSLDKNNLIELLLHANYNETTRVLQFPEGSPLPIKRFGRNQIFVFPQYEVLLEKIWKDRKDDEMLDFIILGNPGIGKTQFGLYVMWKLAQKEISFIYEESYDQLKLYLPGHVAKFTRSTGDDLLRNKLLQNKVFYLTDLDSDNEPMSSMMYNCAICFSSPNERRFKNFAKGAFAQTFYMKLPTVDEVRAMRKVLRSFEKVDEDAFEKQLATYGPIPRLVLDRLKRGDRMLTAALERKGVHALEIYSLKTKGGLIQGKDEDVSHVLVHLDTDDNIHHYYKPASFYITNQMCELYKDSLSNALLAFLKNPNPAFNGAAGMLFDVIGLSTFLPEKTHSVLPLTQGYRMYNTTVSANTDSIPFDLTLKEAKKLPINWLSVPFHLEDSVLYCQPKTNMESIDAFTVVGDRLCLFQLTTTDRNDHPVLGSGLTTAINRVESLLHTSFGRKATLIFVTGSKGIKTIQALFDSELKGNYKTNDSVPKSIQHMMQEQSVIRIASFE